MITKITRGSFVFSLSSWDSYGRSYSIGYLQGLRFSTKEGSEEFLFFTSLINLINKKASIEGGEVYGS